MEFLISNQEGLDALLTVKINEADYKDDFDKSLKDYGRRMKIPGFRPGHVPTGVLKKMIGKDAKREIVERFLQKNIQEYLETQKIKLALSPLSTYHAEDIDWNQDDLEFSYDIGYRPELKPNLAALNKLVRYKVALTDEEVKEDVEKLRQQSARLNPAEVFEAATGCYISVHFTELNDNGEPLEGGVEKTSRYNDSNIPAKLAEALNGQKVESETQVKIADIFSESELPEAFQIDAVSVKDLFPDFKIKLISVMKANPPELNQDLFDQYFPGGTVTTPEEFYTEWRKIMEQYYENQATNVLAGDVKKALMVQLNPAMPENFIKKYFLLSYEVKDDLEIEDYEKKYGEFKDELKWVMLSEYLAEENGIEITEENVIQYTEDMLRNELGRSGYYEVDAKKLRQYADDYLTKENNFNRTAMTLRDGRVFDWILAQITPETEEVSLKNFEELKNNQ